MRSRFDASPGSRYDLTRFAPPAFGRPIKLLGLRLGQADQAATDQASGLLQGLIADITGLIKDLPADSLGIYRDRLKACQDLLGDGKDLVKLGVASECLRKLYQDIKNAKAASPVIAAPSAFPYVPVAIAAAGVIGLITVIVLVSKKKKKK